MNGLSVIESFFYGLRWIGSMVNTNPLPVPARDEWENITVKNTVDEYIKKFDTCPLTDAFDCLMYKAKPTSKDYCEYREYREWKGIRNILAHRAHYGRSISIGSPGGVVWRAHDIQLTDQFTTTRRQWLASTLAELMNGAEIFVDSHL